MCLLGHTGNLWDAKYSSNGDILGSTSDDGTIILRTSTLKIMLTLRRHKGPVHSIAFHASGKILASGSSDKTVMVWGIDGKHSMNLEGHTGAVSEVGFVAASKLLCSASLDSTVRLWDTSNATSYKIFHCTGGYPTTLLTQLGRSSLIVAGTSTGNISVWDCRTRIQVSNFKFCSNQINSVIMGHQQGRIIVGSADGSVKVYDYTMGKIVGEYPIHASSVFSLSFVHDRNSESGSADDSSVQNPINSSKDAALVSQSPMIQKPSSESAQPSDIIHQPQSSQYIAREIDSLRKDLTSMQSQIVTMHNLIKQSLLKLDFISHHATLPHYKSNISNPAPTSQSIHTKQVSSGKNAYEQQLEHDESVSFILVQQISI